MEKISCSIAKDLLPLYIEGILSEETAQVVEMHLQTCESCKKDFEIMRQDFVFPSAPKIQEENEKILKELKHQLKIKRTLLLSYQVIWYIRMWGRYMIFSRKITWLYYVIFIQKMRGNQLILMERNI